MRLGHIWRPVAGRMVVPDVPSYCHTRRILSAFGVSSPHPHALGNFFDRTGLQCAYLQPEVFPACEFFLLLG
jgi:hypothetical protein